MIIGKNIYIVNVGDSRAVMSQNHEVMGISIDHKPMEPKEFERIHTNGGMVYQSSTVFINGKPTGQIKQNIIDKLIIETEKEKNNPYIGPFRVFPGKLSVTRTFGDIEAKYSEFGGKEGVVVSEPDITEIKNGGQDLDFIIIGSDGIFDKLENDTLGKISWKIIHDYETDQKVSLHQICGKIADEILI